MQSKIDLTVRIQGWGHKGRTAADRDYILRYIQREAFATIQKEAADFGIVVSMTATFVSDEVSA